MITIKHQLYSLDCSRVMAIVNVTPDSFAFSCKDMTQDQVLSVASMALAQGADMIDVGGYSTRPGASVIELEEEWRRVQLGLKTIRSAFPDAVISVDTFRAEVARRALTDFGVDIINDVSGGNEEMYEVVKQFQCPYILTHAQPLKEGNTICQVLDYFVRTVDALHQRGIRDIIIDPGFGFQKNKEQNYELLSSLSTLKEVKMPILVGMSRKSMVYQLLNVQPDSEDALIGTSVLHTNALLQGASILRVHDVRAALEVVKICEQIKRKP